MLPVSLVLANVLKIIFKKDSHEAPPPPGSDAALSTTVVKEEEVGEDPLSGGSNVDPLLTNSETVSQMVLNEVLNEMTLTPAEAAPGPDLFTVNCKTCSHGRKNLKK